MPSTADSILRLRLMATGEDLDTWGSNTNTNLELIAAAVGGHVSISLSVNPYNVTAANFTTDNQRYGAITFSGSISVTTSVVMPNSQKFWMIRDNTSASGNLLKIRASDSGDVSFTRGKWHFVLNDGSAFQAIPIDATVTVSGGSFTEIKTGNGTSASTAMGPSAAQNMGFVYGASVLDAVVSGESILTLEHNPVTSTKGFTAGNLTAKTRFIGADAGSSSYKGFVINADYELSATDDTGAPSYFVGLKDTAFVVIKASATTGIPNFNQTFFSVSTGSTSPQVPAFEHALLHVREEQPNGTNGGTFTAGSWVTRTLNTEKTNEITGASLSSNQVTLPAGTYYVRAIAPAYSSGLHKAKIANITDGTDLLIGQNAWTVNSGDQTNAVVEGRFTLSASKIIELQHRCGTGRGTNGLGVVTSFGVVEVYSELFIWKVA